MSLSLPTSRSSCARLYPFRWGRARRCTALRKAPHGCPPRTRDRLEQVVSAGGAVAGPGGLAGACPRVLRGTTTRGTSAWRTATGTTSWNPNHNAGFRPAEHALQPEPARSRPRWVRTGTSRFVHDDPAPPALRRGATAGARPWPLAGDGRPPPYSRKGTSPGPNGRPRSRLVAATTGGIMVSGGLAVAGGLCPMPVPHSSPATPRRASQDSDQSGLAWKRTPFPARTLWFRVVPPKPLAQPSGGVPAASDASSRSSTGTRIRPPLWIGPPSSASWRRTSPTRPSSPRVLVDNRSHMYGVTAPMRSYIDTTLFAIYYHFDLRQSGDDLLGLARSIRQRVGTDTRPLLKALTNRGHWRKFAHEQYHFWQGIRLPFLYRYALLTFRETMLAARAFSRRSGNWREWGNLDVVSPAFHRLDLAHHLALRPGSVLHFGRGPSPDADKKTQFTAVDLLECAASLFEYQISCHDPSLITHPGSFTRWRKRRPAYLELFDFVSRILHTEELALAFTMPLINAAFHTTKPERAFVELACRFPSEFQRRAQGADRQRGVPPPDWHFVVKDMLKELEYDLPYGAHPDTVDVYDDRFYYLSTDWLQGRLGRGNASIQHPVLGPPSTAWLEREREVPELATLLDYPGYVHSEEAMAFATSVEPTIRVVRLRLDDDKYKVFVLGAADLRAATTDPALVAMPEWLLQDAFLDLFAVYGAIRQAYGLEGPKSLRRCFHATCPHYDAACCNGYPMIPEDPADCTFARRMEWFVQHVVDSGSEK